MLGTQVLWWELTGFCHGKLHGLMHLDAAAICFFTSVSNLLSGNQDIWIQTHTPHICQMLCIFLCYIMSNHQELNIPRLAAPELYSLIIILFSWWSTSSIKLMWNSSAPLVDLWKSFYSAYTLYDLEKPSFSSNTRI